MQEQNQICRVCGGVSSFLWRHRLMDLDIAYSQCRECDYVQTEQPYWLERAYSNPINEFDTGVMHRNLKNSRIVLGVLLLLGKLHGKVVDFAGGYGILVRILRDYGVDAWWLDQYCKNLLAMGFDYNNIGQADLVTAFEVFEHFVDPEKELDRLLAISPNVLISTSIIPEPIPCPLDWWYYGTEHGQHIGFFSVKSLEYLARKKGKYLSTNGKSYHLMSERPVNGFLWRLIMMGYPFLRLLTRIFLKSRIWDDYHKISGKYPAKD